LVFIIELLSFLIETAVFFQSKLFYTISQASLSEDLLLLKTKTPSCMLILFDFEHPLSLFSDSALSDVVRLIHADLADTVSKVHIDILLHIFNQLGVDD
jgi:hypothetical protein